MPTKEAIKKAKELKVRRALSAVPQSVYELSEKVGLPLEDCQDALASVEKAKETKEGWVIPDQATVEAIYRDAYGFTPTMKQRACLQKDNNALVFWALDNNRFKGIDPIVAETGLSQGGVKNALKELKTLDLADGAVNEWLRGGEPYEIEYVRQKLLAVLTEPKRIDEWIEIVETEYSQEVVSNAIALLQQEKLVGYDLHNCKYYSMKLDNDSKDSEVQADSDRADSNDDDINNPPLNRIRIDGGTQPRTELNEDVIAEYAEQMREGVEFPAITAYFDGVSYWLADGFHRYWAATRAEVEVAVHFIKGAKRDAILHSVGANANHGLRRSNADKRKAVKTLLEDAEWMQWSDRAIARQCQVSADLVGSVRRELEPKGEDAICRNRQIETSHSRKVQRGDQVYEQRVQPKQQKKVEPTPISQPTAVVEPEPDLEEENTDHKERIVEPPTKKLLSIREDICLAAHEFLDRNKAGQELDKDQDLFWIISKPDPELENFFHKWEGKTFNQALIITPNSIDYNWNDFLLKKSNGLAFWSDSKMIASHFVFYFASQPNLTDFRNSFGEFGITYISHIHKEEWHAKLEALTVKS